MATTKAAPASMVATEDTDKMAAVFVPFGEKSAVKLTMPIVRKYLATPTKNGVMPTDDDIVRFMMLCKARELNPWAGDAYMVGFDSKDGAEFSLITALQALLKRAESHPAFDGFESGVIVKNSKTGEKTERQGDIVYDGEVLLGGWCKVYRKDRTKPFYESLNLLTYKKPTPIWSKDPGGMICKCAEAAALRAAFPTQLGGLYTADEMRDRREETAELQRPTGPPATLEDLSTRHEAKAAPAPEPAPEPLKATPAPLACPHCGEPMLGDDPDASPAAYGCGSTWNGGQLDIVEECDYAACKKLETAKQTQLLDTAPNAAEE